MKIAYLASSNSIHTVKLVNAMAELGHEIHLFTLYPADDGVIIDNKVMLHVLPIPPPWGYYLNARRLKRIFKQLKPDLVHAHYAIGYGILARITKYHPILLSVWGSDVLADPYRNRIKERILRKNLAVSDFIAATSFALANQTKLFCNNSIDIFITPFGVDCDTFKPIDIAKSGNEIVIGTVKGLEDYYGIEYLIRAFALLVDKYSRFPFKLLIVGDGSQKKKYEELANNLGITPLTTFAGKVPNINIPSYLNELDVYVAVSLMEGFGVAVIEASACSIPVVVSSVGGLPEVAQNGVTGFIVPPADAVATAEAIEKIILNPTLKKRFGEEGRKFVLRNYEINKCVQILEEVYKKISVLAGC